MNVNKFWDMFEEELVKSVTKDPDGYALGREQTPEAYASIVRGRMEAAANAYGLKTCYLGTPTFKRLARRIGVEKFSQARLIAAYVAIGGS